MRAFTSAIHRQHKAAALDAVIAARAAQLDAGAFKRFLREIDQD